MGGYAPTIGIIGTVLGLVHVLGNLGEPSTLGEKIASAFVATLWGVMTANVFWFPIANRLKRVSSVECEAMELTIEGVLSIQAGSNPRLIAQKLNSMLAPGETPEQDAA
jgi:chemotaxis protein MotA